MGLQSGIFAGCDQPGRWLDGRSLQRCAQYGIRALAMHHDGGDGLFTTRDASTGHGQFLDGPTVTFPCPGQWFGSDDLPVLHEFDEQVTIQPGGGDRRVDADDLRLGDPLVIATTYRVLAASHRRLVGRLLGHRHQR